MSNLLKEKRALTKLREKLKGRKGKMCRSCKEFGHLACNCRNTKEGEKRTTVPQNKFEVLGSRVMQYEVEEKMIRRHEVVVVECFKCGAKGHKYRVPIMGKEGKGDTCSKITKGAPTEGTSAPCKRKSAGRRKKIEESRGGGGGVHGQATRSTARMEEKLNKEAEEESGRAL